MRVLLLSAFLVLGPASGLPHVLAAAAQERTPKPKKDDVAAAAEIQSILDETEALPPFRIPLQGAVPRLKADRLPPFSARVMGRYRASYKTLADLDKQIDANPAKYPLITAVRRAAAVLDKNALAFSEFLPGNKLPVAPKFKKLILKDQAKLAMMILEYREAIDHLKKAGADRAREKSPRWQANYDYTLSRLQARLVFLHEFNLMLGQIRRDMLPGPAPNQSGWKIVPTTRLQNTDREVKVLVTEYRKTLRKLADEHAGTPWAFLARRDLELPLGLEWQTVP